MNKKSECKNCKYKDWDCKNCYIIEETSLNNEEVFFPNIVITIVLTRQCNLRCNYCGISFTDDKIGYDIIDKFLLELIKKRKQINKIKFEFFGGEPLLEFDKIKYIVDKTKDYNIHYSIVTNGFLFTEDIIDFLNKNNFEVVFSVAIHTKKVLEEKKDLFLSMNLNKFIINFIIEPGKELLMFNIFADLLKLGFNKVTILPVYYTKIWSNIDFLNLDNLLNKISKFYFKLLEQGNKKLELFYIRTNKEVEFNIKKNDVELFLDFDGKIYGDYDTELRLLKDFVGKEVFDINKIYLGDINNNFSLIDVILNRRKINTVKYINNITNKFDLDDNLEKLGKVIYNNNVNLKLNN